MQVVGSQQLTRFEPVLRALQSGQRGLTHSSSRTFTQTDVDSFTGLTGDANYIHAFSEEKSLVPGLLAASLFPAIIGSLYPGAVYAEQTLRFKLPILVGDTVTASVELQHARRGLAKWWTTITLGEGVPAVQGWAVSVHKPGCKAPSLVGSE